MTYVVTQACIGKKHTSCVDVCPVDAFREGPDIVYIDPDVCIDCNACLSECPEKAIFPDSAVPANMAHYIALNADQARVYPPITVSISQNKTDKTHAAQRARFAVIGSGPAGFYSADALLKHMPLAKVDIFERLPTPYGLVRYGVAPDHPRIKSVSAGFERIAQSSQVRFFGNVDVGRDISRQDLLQHYHAVIYATGGSQSRPWSIAGTDADNCFGSAEFVGWYNGHPDHQALPVDLTHTRVAVVGMGNVALDIARMLVLPNTDLARTDIADGALAILKNSRIQEVCLLARRGALQVAFTPKELEQLMSIADLDLIVDPRDLELSEKDLTDLQHVDNSEIKQNLHLLRTIAQRSASSNPAAKRIRFVFCVSPLAVTEAVDGKQLLLAKNRLQTDEHERVSAVATGTTESLDIGLLINATGYQGVPIAGVPFDNSRGVIAHEQACVVNPVDDDVTDEHGKEYAAGWIKRGASGVIGSNKHCAAETVAQLMAKLPATIVDIEQDIDSLLRARQVESVSFSDWCLLDRHEQEQGKKQGRPRRKETDTQRMLEIIRQAKAAALQDEELQARLSVKTHHRSCTLCEAMCGVEIKYQGENIISITGDPGDVHSKGHICPKGYSLQDLHNDPDRLKTPLQKVDGQWLSIGWEEALDIVARRLVETQAQYGNDSVGAYWGNPTSHNLGLLLATGKFRKVLSSKNLFTAASLDQLPHQLMSYLMFGHSQLFTIPDIDRTDYMLMLGANPAASNGSLMSAGNVLERLQAITERGGKLVLIDPRRTESAMYSSEHHFIKPGTDALFLIGVIQHIVHNKLYKPAHLLPLVDEWDTLLGLFEEFSLDEITRLSGIAASDITRIAKEFSSAEKAICYGRMGVSAQAYGALNHWLINVLNIITGNLDRAGGMMFTRPAMNAGIKASTAGSFDSYRSRVRGLPEFIREFPASVMAEEILTPGDGQIKAFICFAGNPALSSPNGRQLDDALAQLDFMVSVDFYLNETSRHADIILPPTGPLEHEQFDVVFNLLAVRNVAKFSEPLFAPAESSRSDWAIMQGLVNRMATYKGSDQPATDMSPEQILDYGLRSGPYGKGFVEHRGDDRIEHGEGLTLERLKRYTQGLDLGPLQPCLPDYLFTEDKKIHLIPSCVHAELQRLHDQVNATAQSSLLLIGRRDLRSNNSWMHNSQRLIKGKNRCTLFMHPDDAATHGVTDDSKVKLTSRVGELVVEVKLSDDIMPGVVSLPHGWGHNRNGIELRVAQTNPGVSVNDLTDELHVDSLSGNAVLNGVPVEIALL